MRYDEERRYDEPESWDGYDDEPPPQVAAFAAAGIGAVVLVVAGLIGLPAAGLVRNALPALGAMLGGALLVWAIGFAVILRRFGALANIGTLLLLFAAGGLVVLQIQGTEQRKRLKEDFRTLAELRISPEGKFEAPKGAETRGPMSRLTIAYFRELEATGRDYADKIATFAIDRMVDAGAVLHEPELIGDCTRYEPAKALSDAKRDRAQAALRSFTAGLRASELPGSMSDEIVNSMQVQRSEERLGRAADLEKRMIDEAIAMCRVLHLRHWQARNQQYLFTSPVDVTNYNNHLRRLKQLGYQADQMRAEDMAQMRRGQEMIARSIGSIG